MNAVRSPRPHLGAAAAANDKGASEDATSAASSDLDLYSDVPDFELGIDEFEELALARLKVLRKIEELKARNVTGENYRVALEKTVKANLTASAAAPPSSDSAAARRAHLRARTKRIDSASHFILRAAYCRTEDLRRWFLAQECALFRHRLERVLDSGSAAGSAALRAFLRRAGMDFDRVTEGDKDELRPYLLSVAGPDGHPPGPAEFASETYYRVPFVQALDLVSSRRCYVRGGHAYVPLNRIVTIVRARFRSALSRSLALASSAFGRVAGESDRIGPLLKSMNSQHTGRDYGSAEGSALDGDELTSANVEEHVPHMPLCMSQLHAGLRRDHKLRHGARLQYYLFLKGAGLSMEESLTFFQREFAKIMTAEQFQKNYAYMIRHLYGKEGKRASKNPYNCMKIIMGQPPQTGEHHGCPYRHYDEENLSSLLDRLGIGTRGDRDVMLRHVRERNYQLACVKHFEATHPRATSVGGVQLDGVGNHPNAWFAASVSYAAAKSGKGAGAASGGGAAETEREVKAE